MAKTETTETGPPVAKSQEQLEQEAEEARKKAVHARNVKKAAEEATKQEALAKTPLNAEEKAFVTRIGAQMNIGRRIMMPASADILRYSQLKARENVK